MSKNAPNIELMNGVYVKDSKYVLLIRLLNNWCSKIQCIMHRFEEIIRIMD